MTVYMGYLYSTNLSKEQIWEVDKQVRKNQRKLVNASFLPVFMAPTFPMPENPSFPAPKTQSFPVEEFIRPDTRIKEGVAVLDRGRKIEEKIYKMLKLLEECKDLSSEAKNIYGNVDKLYSEKSSTLPKNSNNNRENVETKKDPISSKQSKKRCFSS
jgi:hypothetical protein